MFFFIEIETQSIQEDHSLEFTCIFKLTPALQNLMSRIYHDKAWANPSYKERFETLLAPEYWLNRRVESAGPATRHMRPFYAMVPAAEKGISISLLRALLLVIE